MWREECGQERSGSRLNVRDVRFVTARQEGQDTAVHRQPVHNRDSLSCIGGETTGSNQFRSDVLRVRSGLHFDPDTGLPVKGRVNDVRQQKVRNIIDLREIEPLRFIPPVDLQLLEQDSPAGLAPTPERSSTEHRWDGCQFTRATIAAWAASWISSFLPLASGHGLSVL